VVTGVGVNNGVLFIIGSSDRDHVDLNQSGKGKLKVNADIIGKPREFDSASVQQIICYLGEGDDHLTIANQLNIPAVIHGGKGDDHLDTGGGPTVLLGDEGDDHLNGQGGRSILIGGVGKDELNAGSEEDVLIGATTNSDQNDAALMTAILTWNSPATYATRVALINGMFVVVDDGNVDKLEGGSGQDLFYNGVGDQLKGVKKDELILI
jgi:Ca2+-binding RTX toxin-like protein